MSAVLPPNTIWLKKPARNNILVIAAESLLLVLVQTACAIRGTIRMVNGEPAPGVVVKIVYEKIRTEVFTDCNGEFSIDVLQGTVAQLTIPSINLSRRILAPALETTNFINLI